MRMARMEMDYKMDELFSNTVEPPVGGHPLCKKKWFPTRGGLSWEVLHGNKRA